MIASGSGVSPVAARTEAVDAFGAAASTCLKGTRVTNVVSGALGTAVGTTTADRADVGPVPAALVATTSKV
jgi:hypothetical protein